MNKRTIAKVPKEMIYGKLNYSLTEQKLLKVLMAQLIPLDANVCTNERKEDLEQFLTVRTTREELSKIYRNEKFVLGNMKRNLDSLNKPIWIEDEISYFQTFLFSKITIKKYSKEIYFKFNKELSSFLIETAEKHRYAKIHLSSIMEFKSKYSVRFYELLKLHLWESEKKNENFKIEIDKIIEMFELAKTYEIYNNLKRNVLDISVEEINKFTELNISYKALKENHSRKYTHLEFTIETDNKIQEKIQNEINQSDGKRKDKYVGFNCMSKIIFFENYNYKIINFKIVDNDLLLTLQRLDDKLIRETTMNIKRVKNQIEHYDKLNPQLF